MNRGDQSYLANRVDPATVGLFTFHWADTDEEFGVGTLEEFEALKALGIIDPASITRPVQ